MEHHSIAGEGSTREKGAKKFVCYNFKFHEKFSIMKFIGSKQLPEACVCWRV
jgi:hypothetical protein